MYKISVYSELNREILHTHPDLEEHVIGELFFSLAKEMQKSKCCEITTHNYERVPIKLFQATALMLTQNEFDEALKLIGLIASLLPDHLKKYTNELTDIFLFKHPKK